MAVLPNSLRSVRVTVPPGPQGIVRPAPSAEEGESYEVTIREALAVERPDQAEVAAALGAEGPEELEVRARVILEDMRDDEARAAMREELMDRVVRSAVIHLPPALVAERIEMTRHDLIEKARRSGKEPPNYLLDPVFFAERYGEQVRHGIKHALVTEAIAAENGLEASEEQVEAALARQARLAGLSPAQLRKRLGDQGVDGLRRRLTRLNVERLLEEEADVDIAAMR